MHYDYLFSSNALYAWQSFIKLLYKHLRDVEELDSFYFELLEEISSRLSKSAPKRVILEAFVKILEFEGRLHSFEHCYFCSEAVNGEKIALARSFLPAHGSCIYAKEINRTGLKVLYEEKNSALLEDDEIEVLWETLLLGM